MSMLNKFVSSRLALSLSIDKLQAIVLNTIEHDMD